MAVASPVSEEAIVNTTSVDGCTLRTIENKSVDPSSPTIVDPLVSTTVNPTESSSVVSTPTFSSAIPSKSLSELASTTEIVILVV